MIPEIKEIETLSIKEGDTLIVKMDKDTYNTYGDQFYFWFRSKLPNKVKIAILPEGVTLSVVRKEAPSCRLVYRE